mgnify:CR=1 FL=1
MDYVVYENFDGKCVDYCNDHYHNCRYRHTMLITTTFTITNTMLLLLLLLKSIILLALSATKVVAREA